MRFADPVINATFPAMFIGKVAIITGASRGIGLAISEKLHQCGASVVMCARSADALQAHAREFGHERVLPVEMDVRSSTSVEAGVAAAVQRFGKIDFIVNNAGISGVTPITNADSAPWMDIINTNLAGSYHVTRNALAHMPDGGRVVMISSVLGKFGVPGYTAYCSSKSALLGFVRALALEVAPRKIAVNAICPGWTDTEMAWSGMRDIAASSGITVDQFNKEAMSRVPLGEMVQPAEVADLIAFLLSDAGRNITAQAISICGGSTQA